MLIAMGPWWRPIDECMYHCLRRLVEYFFDESIDARSSRPLNIDRGAWDALAAKAPRGHRPVCGFADGYDSDELAECPAVMQLLDATSSDDEVPSDAGTRRRKKAPKQGTVAMRNNLMRLLLVRDSRAFPEAQWITDADRKLGINNVGLTANVVKQLFERERSGSRYDLVCAADADEVEASGNDDTR